MDQTGSLGGGELSLLDIVKELKWDAEVVLFTDGPFRGCLEELGVRVHILSGERVGKIRRESGVPAILSAVPWLFQMRRELRKKARSFDVIYANSQKAFILSALAKLKGQSLIWHLRDMLIAKHFSLLMRRVVVLLGNRFASVVVVNSNATGDAFVKAGGDRNRTRTIYNGVDPMPFLAVSMGDVRRVRTELNLDGKFVIGVFGRLTPWKGQHVVLEALTRLPDTHVLVVGESLFGEQAYAEGLRTLAEKLGIRDRVHFTGFRRDIPLLMKLVDVIVHSSTSPEPFGRVIVEAMLSLRPVVATRAGGAVEIIGDGSTGLLVEPGSAREIALAVTKLRRKPRVTQQMVEAAQVRASLMFSLKAMTASINEVVAQFSGQ